MGSYASGRFGGRCGRPKARTRVEKCYRLDTAWFRPISTQEVAGRHLATGTLTVGDHFALAFGLTSARPADHPETHQLRLRYSFTDHDRSEIVDEPIAITTLPGIAAGTGACAGERWYFLCPRCGHRRKRLYLPRNQSRFGCRGCYDLTYKSVQENVSDAKLWRRFARMVARDHQRTLG